MFSLILAITAIVLVIALIIAVNYWGGQSVLDKSSADATAAGALNEMGQMRAAAQAYQAFEGHEVISLEELVPKYLAAIPRGWAGVPIASLQDMQLSSRQLAAENTERGAAICQIINSRLGVESTPKCADIGAGFYGCCEDDGTSAPSGN